MSTSRLSSEAGPSAGSRE